MDRRQFLVAAGAAATAPLAAFAARSPEAGVTDTDMNSWLHDSDEAVSSITDIVALNRIGQGADIADAVAFFASDDSRWITGQTVEVNGGLYLGPKSQPQPS